MTKAQLASLIARLEHVAARPSMYVGNVAIEPMVTFLAGFMCGILALNGKSLWPWPTYERVWGQRGWTIPKANGPRVHSEMVERGMTPEQVVSELVAIEIDVLRRLADEEQP